MKRTPEVVYASGSGGSGLFALFLVLLVLKLTVRPEWSWWLVTAPLWASAALALALILIVALIFGAAAWDDRRR